MAVSRRYFLRIAGSSAVIVAAGTGIFATTRTPTAALAPWRIAAERYEDPRMRALSYAILAPNPHNRQPWLIGLDRPNEIVLYCDRERLLPETDPFGRQIVIGLGCFLELLRMAAAADGFETRAEIWPEGAPARIDARPVARIRLARTSSANPNPLFRQVLARRSTKEPFDTARPVEAASLATLAATATETATITVSDAPALVRELRALTWQAHLIEMQTPRTLMESVRLMRIGKAEINANPDGIDLGGPFLEGLRLLGQLDRQQIADPDSVAFAEGLKLYRQITGTAMAYVWLVTPANSRHDQIAAGRTWLRVNLAATALGLAIHPLSQALQEYPEMAPLHAQVHARLGATDGQTVQMLGRLGYADAVDPSPRWPLASRIRTTP